MKEYKGHNTEVNHNDHSKCDNVGMNDILNLKSMNNDDKNIIVYRITKRRILNKCRSSDEWHKIHFMPDKNTFNNGIDLEDLWIMN